MVWACILGYAAVAVSFYLYITRTAQVEPEFEADKLGSTPTLSILQGGADASSDRKAA